MINIHINAISPGKATVMITAETEAEKKAIRRYHTAGTSQMGRSQDDTDDVQLRAQTAVDALRGHGYKVQGTSQGFCKWGA